MFSSRKIERELFKCPEIDSYDYSEYPLVEEIELAKMESEYNAFSDEVNIFPYVSTSSSGKTYIELYVWDCMLYPDGYKRFIICEGMRMTDKDEEIFLSYIENSNEDMGTQIYGMVHFEHIVRRNFPGWHYAEYDKDEIGNALSHLYFASHRSGIREILYKAGLNNIAFYVGRIQNINMIGSSPEKIFNSRFPMKLLRIMNRENLVHNLFFERCIKRSCDLYKTFSGYADKDGFSFAQWRYLEFIYDNADDEEIKFSRSLFKKLSEYHDDDIVKQYRQFYKLKSMMPELELGLPKVNFIDKVVEKMTYAQILLENDGEINKKIEDRAKWSLLEYRDNNYSITMPANGFEICKEAIRQDNCLNSYIYSHALGTASIMFLRKNDNPDKSYVTVEINNLEITQVYGSRNIIPDKEVYQFLEKYSIEKNLEYNPEKLIRAELEKLTNTKQKKGLVQYLREYGKRIREAERKQLTTVEYFNLMEV